jgi:hypothetical protein
MYSDASTLPEELMTQSICSRRNSCAEKMSRSIANRGAGANITDTDVEQLREIEYRCQ